jgi:hypothetical protein
MKELAQELVDGMDFNTKQPLKNESRSELHWNFYEYINKVMCNIVVRKSDDKVVNVIPKKG